VFDSKDKEKLKKLGVSDILALSLVTPKSYEDHFLSTSLNIGEQNVIKANIIESEVLQNQLRAKLFCKTCRQVITAIIFAPKAYHKQVFISGKCYFLKGKIQSFNGFLQIIQPKIITEINTIKPIYKTPLQNKTVISLMQKYLTKENLLNEGLKTKEIETLLEIHFPSKNTLDSKTHIEVLKFVEIFRYIKRLRSKKKSFPSLFCTPNHPEPFIKNLPFTLTHDQKQAIDDIYHDLQKNIQARRVIIGDVGSGKTVLIMATAFMLHPSKTILMAPTTILANQLFEEANKLLPPHIKTALHTQKTQIKDDEFNNFHLIIGTHALLYTKLPQAGAILIDEQHRFGAKQRHELSLLTKNKSALPHVFQFSATPIPRTQAMIESSFVDVTLVKEVPFKKDITTKVIHDKDFASLLSHIKKEIDANHQILIIYPLVSESENFEYQSIEEARGFWEKKFSNVYVTHGKDKEKENVLLEFRQKGDILLSTTVVEVGISLPRLSTIVISAAERLGLATLHQLRGRVGRVGLKSWCFLYTKQEKSKRLQEFIKAKNGFEVAELDLKFRKSGDLLDGAFQSGEQFKFFDMSEDLEILKEAKMRLMSG